MALYQLKNYIHHFLAARSTKGHGLHSPFVYELATQVLPDQNDEWFSPIEELRKALIADHRKIEVDDLGAGSRVHATTQRSISAIARHSSKNARLGRLLYRLAIHTRAAHILELGTSLGLSTAYLAKTNLPVTTIEGCRNIAREAQSNFDQLGLKNINLKVGNFDDLLPEFLGKHPECNFVFIDGNHTYEATMRYYEQLGKNLHNDSVIIFDDIYWSQGMQKAWNEIVADQKNQVTIDLFHLGLVFIRQGQAEEHFKIRL